MTSRWIRRSVVTLMLPGWTLNTLLSTYPDSQYQMRAKLAVADTWYREGGSAALAQAEQEYGDFITFFPNAPESSEAQMRIGDIYMKQMDVPDRDYTKAMKAEDAYRTMLKQYPDAPPKVVSEAKQKLREVQEVLATREADLGVFYASRANWPASIARYMTVADTYPLYSHMDDVLIGIGDAYAAEARAVRAQQMPEGPKAKLEEEYDGKAASYYRQVVIEHSAAPHVEDAKERLAAMNLPVPTPTAEQAQISEALEGSRAQYNLRSRLELLVMHKPNTVAVARVGEPPLEDKAATTAPTIVNQIMADYTGAFNPNAAKPVPANANEPAVNSQPETPASPGVPATPAQPLAFQDVPSAGNGKRGQRGWHRHSSAYEWWWYEGNIGWCGSTDTRCTHGQRRGKRSAFGNGSAGPEPRSEGYKQRQAHGIAGCRSSCCRGT